MARTEKKEKTSPEKSSSLASLGKTLRYCKRWLPHIIIATVLALGGTVISLVSPRLVGGMMDTIVAGIENGVDMGLFMVSVRRLIFVYVLGTAFAYGQTFIDSTVTQRAARLLRSDLSRKLDRIPLNYFDTTEKGDVLSVMTNDIGTVSSALASTAASLASAATQFFGVTVMMFIVSPALSGAAIGSSVLGFVGMALIMKASQKYFERRQEDLGRMDGHIEEIFTNLSIVTAYGGKRSERKKFEDINASLYEANWKSTVYSGIMSQIMSFVGTLSYILIFALGVSMMLRGRGNMSLGRIMEFIMYNRLFTSPLSTIASSVSSLQQAGAAAERVFRVLDREELDDESGKEARLENVRGDISFEDVRFGYSEEKEIIHGFTAEVKSGQKVAIVGPTGAGKTTVVNLLMRFYEPSSGRIRIDGTAANELKRENVRELFDMILQDTWLFEGTLRENLVYNTPDVSDEQVLEACRTVGLEHFVGTLPEGLDTVLSEKLELSEGQKQQLTIARAILRDAPLLILDEATSSVDTRTEMVIQSAMDKLMQGRTSFIIAHRLSTVRNADLILVMRDGNIAELGTHEELLARGGFYAELYNSQFEE